MFDQINSIGLKRRGEGGDREEGEEWGRVELGREPST